MEAIWQNMPQVKRVRRDAHWVWFDKGWQDFKAAWEAGLSLGTLMFGLSATLVSVMLFAGQGAYIPLACGMFILLGPLFAVTCYNVSQKLAAGEKVAGPKALLPNAKHLGGLLIYGVVLVIIAALWVVLANSLLQAFKPDVSGLRQFLAWCLETPRGLSMLVFGTVVGGALAVGTFALSFIGLPMVAHQKISPFVAMELSVEALLLNPWIGLGFGFVIALTLAGSMVLGFLPLIVAVPWLGFSTWHAYLGLTGQDSAQK